MVTLVGFATWKLFVFYRTALCHCNEPFCRQSSQQQMLWYLHALTELTWDKLRALLETHTKNSTFIHSPLTRTFGLELLLFTLSSAWLGRNRNGNFLLPEILVFPNQSLWGIRMES